MMKTKKMLLAVLAAGIICPVFSACGDDDDPAEKNPVEKTDENDKTEPGKDEPGKDDPGKDEPGKEPEVKDEKTTYFMEYIFSDDALKLFDVKITKKVGTEQTDYTLRKDTKVTTDPEGDWNGKSTGLDNFEVEKDTKVSIKATIALKANWQDALKQMGKNVTLKLAIGRAESEKDFKLKYYGANVNVDKQLDENILNAIATTTFTEAIDFEK